jgi:hypothetical protein
MSSREYISLLIAFVCTEYCVNGAWGLVALTRQLPRDDCTYPSRPNRRRVLVIGGGDSGGVREVLKHPSVGEVILCDIYEVTRQLCSQLSPLIALIS